MALPKSFTVSVLPVPIEKFHSRNIHSQFFFLLPAGPFGEPPRHKDNAIVNVI
jgi:hypothetical protein